MRMNHIVPLLLAWISTGCVGLVDIEIPAETEIKVESFAGPVTVKRVTVDREGLYHQGFTSGFLGLADFLFLIPRNGEFDNIAQSNGFKDLEDLWRAGVEARLRATGGFAANGSPMEVRVAVKAAKKQLGGYHWIVVSYVVNPVWTLLAGPNASSRVIVDVTFDVRLGGFSKRYHYPYDDSQVFGLYYGRNHRQGSVLGQLCDQLVLDVQKDLPGR